MKLLTLAAASTLGASLWGAAAWLTSVRGVLWTAAALAAAILAYGLWPRRGGYTPRHYTRSVRSTRRAGRRLARRAGAPLTLSMEERRGLRTYLAKRGVYDAPEVTR